MHLDDLQALLDVARHGSVRGAALRGGQERSALRRRLARLEAEVGVPLLLPRGRGMRLTPAGELVATRGRALLAEAAALQAHARSLGGQAGGTARVLAPMGTPPQLRVAALQMLARRHPDLALDMHELPDPLAHAHEPFDLMLHVGPPPEDPALVSHVVARPARRLFGAAGAEPPAELADLADHRLLVWRCPGRAPDLLPLLGGGQHPVRPALVTNEADVLLSAAEAGLGLALVPELFVGDRALEAVLADRVGDRLEVRLTSPQPGRVDPRVRALLDNVHALVSTR